MSKLSRSAVEVIEQLETRMSLEQIVKICVSDAEYSDLIEKTIKVNE